MQMLATYGSSSIYVLKIGQVYGLLQTVIVICMQRVVIGHFVVEWIAAEIW